MDDKPVGKWPSYFGGGGYCRLGLIYVHISLCLSGHPQHRSVGGLESRQGSCGGKHNQCQESKFGLNYYLISADKYQTAHSQINKTVRMARSPNKTKKITAFWDMTPCSLVKVDQHFRGACRLHRPDDGGNMHLWNVSLLVRDYKAPYFRSLSSSYSPPWDPAISRTTTQTFKLKRSYRCHSREPISHISWYGSKIP
jgi:hypothetical protein